MNRVTRTWASVSWSVNSVVSVFSTVTMSTVPASSWARAMSADFWAVRTASASRPSWSAANLVAVKAGFDIAQGLQHRFGVVGGQFLEAAFRLAERAFLGAVVENGLRELAHQAGDHGAGSGDGGERQAGQATGRGERKAGEEGGDILAHGLVFGDELSLGVGNIGAAAQDRAGKPRRHGGEFQVSQAHVAEHDFFRRQADQDGECDDLLPVLAFQRGQGGAVAGDQGFLLADIECVRGADPHARAIGIEHVLGVDQIVLGDEQAVLCSRAPGNRWWRCC